MKLEEGMYARTKNNGICKLYREFHEDSVDVGIGVFPEIDGFFIDKEEISYIEKEDIIKSSYNIIDLIEVGDYVNGSEVIDIVENDVYVSNFYEEQCIGQVSKKNIKSIVTKKQFESMAYEVEEC